MSINEFIELEEEGRSITSWIFIFTALICVISFIISKFNSFKLKLRYKNLPPYEEGLIPYFGHLFSFARHPLQHATSLYEKHGEVFTIKVLGDRLTFLASPEAHGPFLSGTDKDLDQNEPYKFAVPLFGKGVVYDVDLSIRNQQLKFMRGSLKTDKMKQYVDLIIMETELFFNERWKDEEGTIDLRNELSDLIILTASRCLMGNEIREKMFTEIARLFHVLDEGLTPISVFFPYLPIPKHKRRDEARVEMVKLFSSVISERRKHPEIEHNDVLQVFMDAEYTDGKKLSEEEISGLMVALLFAGQHTSSITSSWTGFYILKHQNTILPRIIDEQRKVFEENGKLNYDALQQMDLLHRCIKEALRLTPPLIFIMRKLTTDMTICNYTVPKGDTLFISPALSGRLKSVYTNADEFEPDRYIEPRDEDKKKPFSYVGFGGGRHGCMGEVFAYLQIKTIWSVLFRNFDMEIVGDFPVVDYASMVVGPKHPCLIRYRRKEKPLY